MYVGGTTGGYQLVTPAYYDQSGQLVMANSRAVPQMVRLMSPATLLMSSQHGNLPDILRIFNPLKGSGIRWFTFRSVQCHPGLTYIFNF